MLSTTSLLAFDQTHHGICRAKQCLLVATFGLGILPWALLHRRYRSSENRL